MQIAILFCYRTLRRYLVIRPLALFPCCREWGAVRNTDHHQSQPATSLRDNQSPCSEPSAPSGSIHSPHPVSWSGRGVQTDGHPIVKAALSGVSLTGIVCSVPPASWSPDLSAPKITCMSSSFPVGPVLWRETEHLLSTIYVPRTSDLISKHLLVQKNMAILWWWTLGSERWIIRLWSHR